VVALLFCGAVLFLPLLVLRNGPDASASVGQQRPETAAAPTHAGRSDPPVARRVAARTDRPSRRDDGSTVLPVTIADIPVRLDVPTTTSTVPPTTTTTTDVPPTTTEPPPVAGTAVVTTGVVTYYAHPAGTCASPWLPFGTVVRVTNPANGASVTCVVNDREADTQRSIDLATATFAEIAPLWQGVVDAQLSW
jgi:hypothetical protein